MEFDMEWAKEQLTQNKTKKAVGDAVIHLLLTYSSIKTPPRVDISLEVVDIFSKLALGKSLVQQDVSGGTWGPAVAGDIKVADTVRVKSDAHTIASGKYALNGRVGKVVAVRSGDIIIKSCDDKVPVLDGTHFAIPTLEKLYP